MKALWLLPLLAACAAPEVRAPQVVRPQAVTLYRDTVTALMPGGTLCTAARDGGSGPWRGTFRGCPYSWAVEVIRPTSRPRQPLAPVGADPSVVITSPTGALAYGPPPSVGS